jgi:hypothetical protein
MPNTLGLFPRFITLDLQIEVRPRLEIRILSKFLIMQKSVQAIWQGQNKDNQVETKDRFVVISYMADFHKATVALWCSCNGCFALLSSAIWQTSRRQLLQSVLACN